MSCSSPRLAGVAVAGESRSREFSQVLMLYVNNAQFTSLYAGTHEPISLPPPPLPPPLTHLPPQISLHDMQGAKQTAVTCLTASSCSSQTSCPSSCHRLLWPRQLRRSQAASGKAEGPKLAMQRAKLLRQQLRVLGGNVLVMSTSKCT